MNTGDLLLVIVGAHLRAEASDRPLAYRLRDAIARWPRAACQARSAAGQPDGRSTTPAAAGAAVAPADSELLTPMVCSDLWYLNAPELMVRPAISIGDAEVNAASAYLANRVPAAFVLDDSYQILVDQEYLDLRACLWGVRPAATSAALEMFISRYLDAFLRAAHGMRVES
jgi:hypothetical protein